MSSTRNTQKRCIQDELTLRNLLSLHLKCSRRSTTESPTKNEASQIHNQNINQNSRQMFKAKYDDFNKLPQRERAKLVAELHDLRGPKFQAQRGTKRPKTGFGITQVPKFFS